MNQMTGEKIYNQKIKTGETWPALAKRLNLNPEQCRKRAREYYENNNLPPPQKAARIIGGFDEEPRQNGKDLWQRAISIQKRQVEKQDKKASRRVIYDDGPVVLVTIADLHLGSMGVNYLSIDSDIRLIQELDKAGINVAVLLVGDLLDGFIIGRLKDLRLHSSPFLAIEEWGLVDYALERLAPFLIGSVAGNHDNWSWSLTGIDLLRQRHRQLTPGILYDPYELQFILQVADQEIHVIARHNWRGRSMYNPTHGMEHKQHSIGRDADVKIGAHTHAGSLCREFNNGDKVGHAIICGSYKEEDTYAIKLGLPPALPTSAAAVVLDEDGIMFSTSNVWSLARLFC